MLIKFGPCITICIRPDIVVGSKTSVSVGFSVKGSCLKSKIDRTQAFANLIHPIMHTIRDGARNDLPGLCRGQSTVSKPLDLETARLLAQQTRAELGLDFREGDDEQPSTLPAATTELSGRQRLVVFKRPDAIQKVRSELPIIGMEQEIVEAVLEADVVVLSGETGCGKTTQVPHLTRMPLG